MMEQIEMSFDTEAESTSNFRFKVTNLRKSAYPTNAPEESDYSKFRVGDLLCKGTSYTTVFEVVAITREPLTPSQYTWLLGQLKRYGGVVSDIRASNLLEEYKKNGNFGICRITIKALMRGGKKVSKARISKFLELEQIRTITYKGYQKMDIPSILRYRDAQINKLTYSINTSMAKRTREMDLRKSLVELRDEIDARNTPANPPVAVQTETTAA